MSHRLSRRQLLRYAALVAATYPAAKLLDPDWSLADDAVTASSDHPAVPMNLELVTATDTQAVITWFTGDPKSPDRFGRPTPVKAPGRVLIGEDPNPTTWREVGVHGPTPYHHVEVDDLEPGHTYYYRAESNGVQAVPTAFSPRHPDPSNGGVFTTLGPPDGPELFRVAWLNDMHFGEHTSGLAISDPRLPGGGFPPGYPANPRHPYWRFMGEAAVAQALAQGCRLLLVNGDISNEAEAEVLAEAKAVLDGFGTLGTRKPVSTDTDRAYFVTRGNHDRAHQGEQYDDCPPVSGHPDFFDCFRETFAAGFDRGTTRFTARVRAGRRLWHFVGLDSCDITSGNGIMPDEEREYLESKLQCGEPVIPLFHHPVSDIAILTSVPPGIFGVQPEQARRFREMIARYPNVAAVYNGHTHRNHRTRASDSGDIPYFEGGATKEYPGGYTTVRLYADGFMVNFWKLRDRDARAWSERSRGEYLGLYPYYTLGGLRDRNWVRRLDA